MDVPPDSPRRPRSAAMSKVMDSAVLLAAATGFLFIFGFLYSRYYLYSLSFPYQFIDASTTFFIMRSTTPIFISFSYMITLLLLVFAEDLLNFFINYIIDMNWLPYIIVSMFSIVIFLSIPILVGIGMLYIWGYGYIIKDSYGGLTLIVLILMIFILLKSVFIDISENKNEHGIIVNKFYKNSRILFTFIIYTYVIIFSFYSAITFGRTEAEKLIEGKSRNSLEISFTTKDNSVKPTDRFILVMIYDDDYYVTKMANPAPSKPTLLVIPKDDVTTFTIQRLNS